MRTHTLIISGILTALFLTSSFTLAQQFERKREMKHHPNISERLNLTDEQETKIEQLRLEHQKKMIDLRTDVEKLEIELQQLKSTNNYTREDYLNKIEEIIAAKNKIELERANHQMDVYENLDAEQKEIWNSMSKKFHHKKNMKNRKMRQRDIY